MIHQVGFQNILKARFAKIREKNSAYSLRSFAVKLGVGSGALSQMMKGSRSVSERMAFQILDRLKVSSLERAHLVLNPENRMAVPATDAFELKEDQYAMIAEWYHSAIISLISVTDFKNDSQWIAGRLGIAENQVKTAIERLLRLGLISMSSNGKLRVTKVHVRTTDNIPSDSLKKAHLQTLELAKKSLLTHSVDQRDFTHLTVPTSLGQIKLAKAYLRQVQQELCSLLMDTTEKDEVYRLSFELFPMTNIKDKGAL